MILLKLKGLITWTNVAFLIIAVWFGIMICMMNLLEEYQDLQTMNILYELGFDPEDSEESRQFVCRDKDWVTCHLSECHVAPEILEQIKEPSDLECSYRDIIHVNDWTYSFGDPLVLNGDHKYILNRSDFVEIKCTLKKFKLFSSSWVGHGVGFRPVQPEEPLKVVNNTYNVLIFAYDSASRNGFIDKLPKSYKYLKEDLGAVILNEYNIVGHGTPAALFPLLTGKRELELPDCAKDTKSYFDDTEHFIFHKVKKAGYRTAYFEDMADIGTFQFRFNGFRRSPADHYLRTLFIEADRVGPKIGRPWYCVGGTPIFKLMMNLTHQFLTLNGKKFIFTFVSGICHDDFSVVRVGDQSFVEFLQEFKHKGLPNNTFLIVMGDHGPRFTLLRNTRRGRLDERLPFMAIRLPDDLKSNRPDAETNLINNVNTLTCTYDIYTTVLDVMDMREHWNKVKLKGSDLTRGMTLLEPIPKNRSCADAGISRYWCARTRWRKLSPDFSLYQPIARAFVDHINNVTKIAGSKCVMRSLTSIEWVMEVRRKHAKDDKEPIENTTKYYVKLSVGPGRGDFEAAVAYDRTTKKFHINTWEISRTNRYYLEPYCIIGLYPQLYPYCYCRVVPLTPLPMTTG